MTRNILLRGPEGHELDLCSGKYQAGTEPKIFGAPPPAVTATEAVGLPGARFRSARWLARPLRLPMRIFCQDQAELERAINELACLVDPTAGDCVLVYDRGDGSNARRIEMRYVGGLEAGIIDDHETNRSLPFTLNFIAHDPFWRDDSEIERELVTVVAPLLDTETDDTGVSFDENLNFDGQTYGSGAQSMNDNIDFDEPVTNFDGEAGAVQTIQATIGGDVKAWPNWTITGPADSISLINSTNGERFTLTTVLAANDEVFIETEPGFRVARLNGDTIWEDITAGSTFWGLEAGKTNLISVAAENMVDGQSLVSMKWRERFLTC